MKRGNHLGSQRRPKRARCAGLLGSLILASSAAGATQLKLGSVALPGKGEVRFETRYSQQVDQPDCDVKGKNVDIYSCPGYSICIDLDDIEVTKYGSSLRYHFYVAQAPMVTAGPIHFIVDGEAVGAFLPQMAEVDLFVGEDLTNAVPKRIHLPIFSSESPSYLGVTGLEPPMKVKFTGSTDVGIALKNQIPWPVTVTEIRPPIAKARDLWKEDGMAVLVDGSEAFHSFDLEPSAERHDVVALRLKPSPVKAFLETFFARDTGKDHDAISLTVEHRTRWGGIRSLDIRVPVRFVPWPPLLFLAVAVGTVIGSLARLFAGSRQGSRWLKALGTSLVVGIIAELATMLLVQLDSELRLFGLRLDPFELPPALFIGIVTGLMGFRSLDLLEEFIDRIQNPRPPGIVTEAQDGRAQTH